MNSFQVQVGNQNSNFMLIPDDKDYRSMTQAPGPGNLVQNMS